MRAESPASFHRIYASFTLHVRKYSTFKFLNTLSFSEECSAHILPYSNSFCRIPQIFTKINPENTEKVCRIHLDPVLTDSYSGSKRYALNALVSVWSSLWVWGQCVWAGVGWCGGIDSIQAVVFCLHIFLSTHSTIAPLYPSVPLPFVWWGLSLSLCVHLCGWVSVSSSLSSFSPTVLQCIVGRLDLNIVVSPNHNWLNA